MKAIFALGLSLFAGTALGAENVADTTNYVALVNGGTTKAGHQTVTRDGDGTTRVEFIFKDNGRGPELKEEFKLGKDGTFISYHVAGQSTPGAPARRNIFPAHRRQDLEIDVRQQRMSPARRCTRHSAAPLKVSRSRSRRWPSAATANFR